MSTLLTEVRRKPITILACAILSLTAGCSSVAWQDALHEQLPVLGHRNWIVIADSAYPSQTAAGIRTIYTGGEQLEVVRAVLEAVDRADHVKPIVYVDAELEHVGEEHAPGIGRYRDELKGLLKGHELQSLAHDQIIAKLDKAGQTFHVLLLKTDLTLPYTSVFLQLDAAYWSAEAERALREAMGSGR